MSKEYLQKLANDKKHMEHITLEIAARYLSMNIENVLEELYENSQWEDGDESPDIFAGPLEASIKNLIQEWQKQAGILAQTCICYYPDDKRVYQAMSQLLRQLAPQYPSTAFARNGDEGYYLEVNDQVVFSHVGPDEAIEATRLFVESKLQG